MKRVLSLGSAGLAALLLAACGGGGGGEPAVVPVADGSTLPAEATESPAGLAKYIGTQAKSGDADGREPIDLGSLVLPQADSSEPLSVE